jgi:hypothetical protein
LIETNFWKEYIMTQQDFSQIFSCPRCGTRGAIYLVKVEGTKIIVKQRCPTHGGKRYTFPRDQTDLVIPHIRNELFRCFKCGQEAPMDSMKESGYWTMIRCACPTHGNKQEWQKIWSTLYPQIVKEESTAPQPAKAEPTTSDQKRFCHNCGTQLEGKAKFCFACGAALDREE